MVKGEECMVKGEIWALVVDDNVVSRTATVNLLKMLLIHTEEASDGREAVEILRYKKYDVIFMDLLMPYMDGVEATKLIRLEETNRHVPIIGVSGNKGEDIKQFLHENQMQAMLTKPLQLPSLYKCLIDCLPLLDVKQLRMVYEHKNILVENASKEQLSNAFINVSECDIEEGLYFVLGNIEQYLGLLNISMKQLKDTEQVLHEIILQKNVVECKSACHALKSVLYYVGAKRLADKANELELFCSNIQSAKVEERKITEWLIEIKQLFDSVHTLWNELEQAMNAYNSSINGKLILKTESECAKEEVQELIELVLYHAKKFEYVEMTDGIHQLLKVVPNADKPMISQVLVAANEFDYNEISRILEEVLKKDRGEAR